MYSQEKQKGFLIQFGFWAAVAAIALVFMYFLLTPLIPFIIAFAVAAMLQPVMKKLRQKWRFRDGILAAVVTVATYVVLVGLVLLLLLGLFSAVTDWASGLPDKFTHTITPWLENISNELLNFVYMLDPGVGSFVQNMVPDALSTLGSTVMDFSVNLVSWASSVGTKLPGAMLAAIICVIATVFLVKDYEKIYASVLSVFPPRGRIVVNQMRVAIVRILGNFARSYMLILFITFMEVFVGLALIGYENAAVIAMMVALFDILPVLGSSMIMLPWSIITLLQGSIRRGIGLFILYLVVVIVRQIIEPRIVSKRVGLHPLSTLLFIWLGLKLFGGVGVLALPIFVLILKDLHESGLLSNIVDPDALHTETVSTGTDVPQLSEEEELS